MSTLRSATLCVLTAAFAASVAAETTMPDIVVTATRTPLDASRIAAATTVIDREDIQSSQVQSLPELLRGVAGLNVAETGGLGKQSSVFLRGTESDQVLVLINGVRVSTVSAGLAAFELIPVEHIERIEIVRGPRASQWGSEAIGGVIQIFTRSGAPMAAGEQRFEAGAGGGSYNTFRGHAATAGRRGSSHYQASVAYLNSDGFDAREPIPGQFGFDQPDDDGHSNLSFQLRGGHRFNERFDVDAFVLRAEGTTEFDGSFQDEADFVQQVLGARADWRITDRWGLRLRAGEHRDESENFSPDGAFASRFDSKRQEATLLTDIEAAPGHDLTLGADFRDDQLDSNNDFTESSRYNTGAFVQYLGTYGAHNLTGSARFDDNEAFGTETTGGLGWSVNLDPGIRLYASWGTAFKTPTFNELFFPGFGNPDLDPETSESYEAGVEGRPSWGTWSVRAFRTDVDDLIATVFDPATGSAFPRNVNEARIDGIEAEIRFDLAGYEVGAALSVMDPEDRDTGNQLPRRPETSFSVDVSRSFDRLRVGGELIAQDERFDDVDNEIEVDSFATVNLTADYELSPGLFLRGRIGNLFDSSHETVATFNSADRHFLLSVLYQGQR